MAGVRVEVLLLVLTVTLLLVSVQGWDPIDSTELENFYESGQWAAPQTVTATGKAASYDTAAAAMTSIASYWWLMLVSSCHCFTLMGLLTLQVIYN